jgi:hypothetical protein
VPFAEFVNQIPAVALTALEFVAILTGARVAWFYRTNRQASAVAVRSR